MTAIIEYPYQIGSGRAQRPRSPPDTRAGTTRMLLVPNSVGEDITIATWDFRTLRAVGKLEELFHEMDIHKWSILGFCEMRWYNSEEMPTDEVTECTSD